MRRECIDCGRSISAFGGRKRCDICAAKSETARLKARGGRGGHISPALEDAARTDKAQRDDAEAQDLFDRSDSKTIDDMLNAGAALPESESPLNGVRALQFRSDRMDMARRYRGLP